MARTDSEIHHGILRELKRDGRVLDTEIGVEVEAGTVTLTGSVSSLAKRKAAEEIAHRVSGVKDLANDIRVRVAGDAARSATDIATSVRRALESDLRVSAAERVHCTVANGFVTLHGDVDDVPEREAAEQVVRGLAGVTDVRNELHVRRQGGAEDVRLAIEDALARRAQCEANAIEIAVQGGHVRLTGVVSSVGAKHDIQAALAKLPGILQLEDCTRVGSADLEPHS